MGNIAVSEYIGKRFGHLTVIGEAPKTHEYSNRFLLQCDCGKIIEEQPARVINGHKKTCGRGCPICKSLQGNHVDFSDYIGKQKNELTVIEIVSEHGKTMLKCKCSCGKETLVLPYQFKNGEIKSCGCLRNTLFKETNGRSKHPLYGIWRQMMQRCYNEKSKIYRRYGGRGIYVCEEWHDFFKFVEWSDSVGGRPEGYTLDRRDNNGPYCPENCRWATMKTQNINKSDNIVIEYNGRTQTLVEWAKELGINWVTFHNRYVRGWRIERMMTEPVHTKPDRTAGA